ncbi:hypothetical protein [Methylobacterium variabile]|nr:hypothetical protein [Methylobacterium variabile]
MRNKARGAGRLHRSSSNYNSLAKQMLSAVPFAAKPFSGLAGIEGGSSYPRGRVAWRAHSRCRSHGHSKDHATASATMTRGDEAVFDRLDLAEASGI